MKQGTCSSRNRIRRSDTLNNMMKSKVLFQQTLKTPSVPSKEKYLYYLHYYNKIYLKLLYGTIQIIWTLCVSFFQGNLISVIKSFVNFCGKYYLRRENLVKFRGNIFCSLYFYRLYSIIIIIQLKHQECKC